MKTKKQRRSCYEKERKKDSCLRVIVGYDFGSVLTVNAATTTQSGEYGGAYYSASLTLEKRSHVSASIFCAPESPSDVYSVRIDGLARNNFDGYDYIIEAYGSYNSCYKRLLGDYANIRCSFYIGATQVEYMTLYA